MKFTSLLDKNKNYFMLTLVIGVLFSAVEVILPVVSGEVINAFCSQEERSLNLLLIFVGISIFDVLLYLKASGAFEKIKEYLNGKGVVFGGSAGAIIFGKDLEACRLDDTNEVNLSDTDGFNVLNGTSILCHYTNRTPEKDEESRQYLLEVSQYRKVVALPEEVTLFVNDEYIETIGNRPYFFFENGAILKQNEEQNLNL